VKTATLLHWPKAKDWLRCVSEELAADEDLSRLEALQMMTLYSLMAFTADEDGIAHPVFNEHFSAEIIDLESDDPLGEGSA
jgi:hypothetical protein